MLLQHTRTGDGETVVLIPGLGCSATIWKPLIAQLGDFDVVAVDLPGHGRTPMREDAAMDPLSLAEHVRETLDDLGIKKAHLIGNSLGAWIAIELAAAHPDRVHSVMALAPAGMRDVPLTRAAGFLRFNRRLARVASPFFKILLRSTLIRAVGFARNSPIWRTWSVETCHDAAIAMATSTGYDEAFIASLGRVANCALRIPPSVPLRVIFGDTDNILPAKSAQSRAYLPAHGTWEVWERCGHAIQLDYPERVAAVMRSLTDARHS
jgi:pimeloyl-ACP methyl ester carboxylesterase